MGIPTTRGQSRFLGSRLGQPPRQVSPALRRWALKRFVPRLRWGLLCAIAAATMSGGISFVVTYFSSAIEWLFWVGVAWIGLDFVALIGTLIFMRAGHRRRGRQLLALVERGMVRYARVLANHVDYATPANGSPKIVVALEIDGRSMEIRGFDSDDADLFPPDAVLEVVYAENIPGIVFPTSRIPAI